MTISRRNLLAGSAAVSLAAMAPLSRAAIPVKSGNVVLVHGRFADGSCWLDVIKRVQAAGLNVTSVQNPLTTLPEAVDAARRVLNC